MVVYDDTVVPRTMDRLRRGLLERACARGLDGDALRSLMIAAGQAEQAVEDGAGGPWAAVFRSATDAFARAFLARWNGGAPPDGAADARARAALDHGAAALAEAGPAPETDVPFKTPEGFAHYALFPEQFALAALRWSEGRAARRGRVLVVGIRGIGTTLSALVTELLRSEGWDARRVTTRPTGDPFARVARLPADAVHGAPWALVVDEGPGISGSSMAAVAVALRAQGVAPERIALLCGHGGGPGAEASPEVRSVWNGTPVFPASDEPPRWDGRGLWEDLERRTVAAVHGRAAVSGARHLGGGAWRDAVYDAPRLWPAVSAPLERAKYRVHLSDGTAVLWKFAGLQDAPAGARPAFLAEAAAMARRAECGWTVAPLAAAHGFIAMPWVEGRPLRRADATCDVAAQAGRYVAAAAGPPMPAAERDAAMDRLARMLEENLAEGLSPDAARRGRAWADRLRGAGPTPSAGDGRLAPHEWRCRDGRLLKLDASPHDVDHTIAGRQPVAWDLAGAMVEWGLRGARARAFLDAYLAAGGVPVSPDTLAFYRLAYAAFRMGACALFAWLSADDPEEGRRQRRAEERYRRLGRQALAASGA